MEENLLKDMEFSIISKEGEMTVKLVGSNIGLAALITWIAMKNREVKEIIEFATVGLNAKEVFDKLGEPDEHTANH